VTILEQTLKQAAALYASGRYSECEQNCQRLVAKTPQLVQARHLLGASLAKLERPAEALVQIDAALALKPGSEPLAEIRGSLLQKLRRYPEALTTYDAVLVSATNNASVWCSRAMVLKRMGRLVEALESFNRGLALNPEDLTARNNRANTLRELGRHEEARIDYDACLKLKPGQFLALFNRANLLLSDLDLPAAAAADFDAALALDPQHERARQGYVEARNRDGIALLQQNRDSDALTVFDAGLRRDPQNPALLENRGAVLKRLKRYAEAALTFDTVLSAHPRRVSTLIHRGANFMEANYHDEALADFDAALAIEPDNRAARLSRATVLGNLGRHADAIVDLQAVLAENPDETLAFGLMAGAVLHACDWKRREVCAAQMAEVIERNGVIPPLTLQGYSDDPAQLRRNAEAAMRQRVKTVTRLSPHPFGDGRIRIAYLSADFRPHPVAHQIVDLIERHDRARFEIIGVALGADARTPIRARLESAFDVFHDVTSMSDEQAAELLHGLKIDIAVDLQGHTEGTRPEILARRPAPIQVSWLGYPGTTGADFIDYIIADPETAPTDHQPWFSERIVQLPITYMPNDSKRSQVRPILSRVEAGLPENGFVFCSFNHNWKITPPVFDVWMRLLRDIPGSVMWLRTQNQTVGRILQEEAAGRAINPARLIFAPRTPTLEDHAARLALADLVLDTLPYAGHATTCDALWAGVPVLTCRGRAFAGRVGGGLLKAIGIEELITNDLATYETVARDLANNPDRLASLKRRLVENRSTHPLFDTDRFRQDIESAYLNMIEIMRK
jgi:protein O-GlcNAc transferase